MSIPFFPTALCVCFALASGIFVSETFSNFQFSNCQFETFKTFKCAFAISKFVFVHFQFPSCQCSSSYFPNFQPQHSCSNVHMSRFLFPNFKFSNFRSSTFQLFKKMVTYLPTKLECQIIRYENNVFQGCARIVLVCF